MYESELYKELGMLTKDKDRWEESAPFVSSLLAHESVKIQAKALWLIGEIGLAYPRSVHDYVPAIASFLDSPVSLLRERAINALGRIGRGDFRAVEPYWEGQAKFHLGIREHRHEHSRRLRRPHACIPRTPSRH